MGVFRRLTYVLIVCCIALPAQRRVDPRNIYHRVIGVLPLVGSGPIYTSCGHSADCQFGPGGGISGLLSSLSGSACPGPATFSSPGIGYYVPGAGMAVAGATDVRLSPTKATTAAAARTKATISWAVTATQTGTPDRRSGDRTHGSGIETGITAGEAD